MQSNVRKSRTFTVRLSDPAGGCDQKTAVGSSVLARDQQGPVGQTPARQSYPQSVGGRRERGGFGIKKTNSRSLPCEAGKRQKRFVDSRRRLTIKRIRVQGQEQIVFGVLTSKQIPFLIRSFVGRDLGGFRFFFHFCPVFCSVFFLQFAVPFFIITLQFRFFLFSVCFFFCLQFRLLFASSRKSIHWQFCGG